MEVVVGLGSVKLSDHPIRGWEAFEIEVLVDRFR